MKSNTLKAREQYFEISVMDFAARPLSNGGTFVSTDKKARTKLDVLPEIPVRTFLRPFTSYKRAKRWGDSRGTVIACNKIDPSYYLKKIERLNIIEKPIVIPVETEEFELGANLEITQAKGESYKVQFDK